MPRIRVALSFTLALIVSLPVAARSSDVDTCANSVGASFMNADVRVVKNGLQIVEGLQPLNFAVTIGGVRQPVCKVALSPSPVSIGILLDGSESMVGSKNDLFGYVTAAIKQVLDSSSHQDEYFLVYVKATPEPLPQFTSDVSQIRAGLVAKPKGRTALVDSVCVALAAMKRARYSRRVLLILSDGLDNESKRDFKDLRQAFDEAPIPIFLLLPVEPWREGAIPPPDQELRRNHLIEFVNQSGGISVAANGRREIAEKMMKLNSLVREPYSLVFPGPLRTVNKHERLDLRIDVIGVDQPVQPLYRSVRMWQVKADSSEGR